MRAINTFIHSVRRSPSPSLRRKVSPGDTDAPRGGGGGGGGGQEPSTGRGARGRKRKRHEGKIDPVDAGRFLSAWRKSRGTPERAFPRKLIAQGDLIRSPPYRRYSTTESPAAPENKGSPPEDAAQLPRTSDRYPAPSPGGRGGGGRGRAAGRGAAAGGWRKSATITERSLSALSYAPFEATDETNFRVASDER